MSKHEKFNFKSLDDIKNKVTELGLNIDFSEDFSPLWQPKKIGGKTAPNSMAVLPMEGCDSNTDGSPSDLVYQR